MTNLDVETIQLVSEQLAACKASMSPEEFQGFVKGLKWAKTASTATDKIEHIRQALQLMLLLV